MAAVIVKYGKVHQLTREKYGPDTGFAILNGVRGAHMEISKVIPSQVFIQHFQVRVSYEGMPNRCFFCDSTSHVKAECPKRSNRSEKPASEAATFADTLSGSNADQSSGKENTESPPQIQAELAVNETPAEPSASVETADLERTAQAFEELAYGASGGFDVPPSRRKDDDDEYIVDYEDPEWFTATKKRNRAVERNGSSDSSGPDDSKVLRLLDKQVIRTRAQAKLRGNK